MNTAVPEQLRDMEFILLNPASKTPTHKYKNGGCRFPLDHPDLQHHIAQGNPIAVYLTSDTLVVDIEREGLDHPLVTRVLEGLPPTFTVRSGGGGQHHYYHVPGWEEQTPLEVDGVHVGDIKAPHRGYCLIPPSPHPSGNKYRVKVDRPITHLDEERLRRLLSPLGVETLEERQARELREWGRRQAQRITRRLQRENTRPHKNRVDARDLIDRLDLPTLIGFKDQGAHPVHGSTTGRNLKVSAEHQTWYCFRHNTWGDTLEMIAIMEGIISCAEARKGENAGPCLQGTQFKEALKAAADRDSYNHSREK